MHNKMLSKLN